MQIVRMVFAIAASLAMLLPPATSRAAWPPGGIFMGSMGYGGRTNSPTHVTIPEGAGSCLVSLDPDLWRVDANGGTAHLWPVPGIYPGAAGDDPAFASDGAGGFIVVWMDSRDGAQAMKLYAQHITAGGAIAPGWPDHGVVLSGVVSWPRPLVVADGAGGAFVAWTVATTPYAQHVSGDGQVAAPGGAPVAGPPAVAQSYGGTLVPDGTGGAILVWVDLRNSNSDLSAQRVDRELRLAWEPAGAVVTSAAYGQDHPVALGDGEGGAFIAWHDRRSSTSAYTSSQKQDIYAVRLTASGAVAPGWAPGGSPVRIASKWADDAQIIGDGAGGALISSFEFAIDGPSLEIADASPSGGLSVLKQALDPVMTGFSGANNGRRHGLIADGSGGVFIAWAGVDGDFVFHLVADGLAAPGWTQSARVDEVAYTWTGSLSLAPDGAGGTFVVFERCRVAYPDYEKLLYATRVTGGGPATVDLGPAPAARFALRGARPNPTGRDLAVAFALPDGAPARLELADLAGRRIEAREVGAMGAGEHVLRLGDSRDLAPGIYVVRLTRGGRALTARVAVIR